MSQIAVIDVETTGLNPYRHDRIVEIAAVVIRTDGTVVNQFVSLVNPERDIGPTSIHGLVTRDLIDAPRFADIAGAVLETLDGSVAVAGHNVRFDHSFLTTELRSVGLDMPDVRRLCTMHLSGGGTLECACDEYGVSFDGEAHSAFDDALAATRLLLALLNDAPQLASEIASLQHLAWPKLPIACVKPVTRDQSRKRQKQPPTYLQRLLKRMVPELPEDSRDSAGSAYLGLLDRALEDRHIDEREGAALLEVAERWGIDPGNIRALHASYLYRLAQAAVSDGIVTAAERKDLVHVAQLLGASSEVLSDILKDAAAAAAKNPRKERAKLTPVAMGESFAGKRVCFTGECQCRLNGEPLTREIASEIAAQHGLVVAESVTKKLDILVVADPLTQSGKAKKARDYGIRILHEPVFWQAVGVQVD